MNKKFSTLAVAAMLASAFTAYAGPGDVVTKLAEGNNGKQYQLRAVVADAEAGYLTLEDHDKALKLTSAEDLDKIGTSLWCVDVTRENEGKNPIFDFTNKAGKSVLDVTVGGWNVDWDKATYSGLWVDKNEAHVGGEVRGWEFTPVLGSTSVPMFGVANNTKSNSVFSNDEAGTGTIDNTKLKEFSGSDDMKYEYSLIAYNENGKEKEVQFKTSRILKNNAYLELEIMQIRGVVNWREVEKNDLPEDVKERIDREIR